MTTGQPARSERVILAQTLLALGQLRFRERRACVVYRQSVGRFRQLYSEAVVSIGVEGLPDIGGIAFGGHALFVETKSDRGVLREAQRHFRDVALSFNAIWLLARSREEACEGLLAELERRHPLPGGFFRR